MKVHSSNFSHDHKDYTNFDNAFSIIMKNFPEPIEWETNGSLQESGKSKKWEMAFLNLKKDGQ